MNEREKGFAVLGVGALAMDSICTEIETRGIPLSEKDRAALAIELPLLLAWFLHNKYPRGDHWIYGHFMEAWDQNYADFLKGDRESIERAKVTRDALLSVRWYDFDSVLRTEQKSFGSPLTLDAIRKILPISVPSNPEIRLLIQAACDDYMSVVTEIVDGHRSFVDEYFAFKNREELFWDALRACAGCTSNQQSNLDGDSFLAHMRAESCVLLIESKILNRKLSDTECFGVEPLLGKLLTMAMGDAKLVFRLVKHEWPNSQGLQDCLQRAISLWETDHNRFC